MSKVILNSPFLWATVERVGRQVVQFAIGITLARLLTPADYGLMGIAAAFLAISQVFAAGGLHAALVQRETVDASDQATAQICSLILAVFSTIVIVASAGSISEFFGHDEVALVLCVASMQIVVTALSTVHSAHLVRNLQFKELAKIGLISTLTGGCIAVGLAWHGYGVWSLVWQALISSFISTCLFWRTTNIKFRNAPTKQSFRRLIPYSGWTLSSGLLFVFSEHLVSLMMARFYSLSAVGLYNRANQLQQVPAQITNDIISRVSFPVFSSLQNNHDLLILDFRALMRLIAIIHVSGMIYLSFSGWLIVPTLFGEQWKGAVPFFEILCFAGALYPINAIQVSLLNALGKVRLVFYLEIPKKLIQLSVLVVATAFDTIMLAWAMVAYYLACTIINFIAVRKLVHYKTLHFLKDVLFFPTFVVGAALTPYIVSGLLNNAPWPAWPVAVISLILGALSIILIWRVDIQVRHDLSILKNFTGRGA